MKKSVLSLAGAVSVGVVALGLIGSSAAVADPGSATDYRTYAAVGSDTTQSVWNGLANGTVSPSVASWDAFPPAPSATIQTKSSGPSFNRPQGSGAGVQALSASFDASNHNYQGVDITNQVDFARSSSGAAKDGTDLTYLPFARDAVSLAVKTSAAGSVDVSTQQLANIYSCVAGANTITVGTTTVTVNAKLPQASSGTRAFFLKAIGVATPGSCVTTVGAETDGGQLTANGDVIPFSAAQWIGQKNGVATNTITNDEILASVNTLAPTAGSGSSLTPGALYGSTSAEPSTAAGTFARDTYNVVTTAAYTSNSALATTVLKSDLKKPAAINLIKSYGFLTLSYVGDPTVGAGLASHQSKFKH